GVSQVNLGSRDQMKGHLALAALASLSLVAPSMSGAQISEAAGIRAVVPFELGRFDLRLGGEAHQVGSRDGARTPFLFESTASLRLASSGLWLGSGFEGVRQVDSQSVRPLLRFGAWRSFSRIQISVGATTRTARLGGRAGRTWRDTVRVYGGVRDSTPGQAPPRDTGRIELQTFGDSGSPSRVAT